MTIIGQIIELMNVMFDIESGIITNANTKDELNDQVLNLNIRGKSKKSNNDE